MLESNEHKNELAVCWLVRECSKLILKASLLTYFILYLIESIDAGFVTNYFNLNIILVTAIISGGISIILKKVETGLESIRVSILDYLLAIIFGLFSGVMLYRQVQGMGRFALIISVASGLIICLLMITLLKEEQD